MPKDLSYDIIILLKQLADGDEKVFRLIFDHYKGPFHAAAFKMTRSANIAGEITQEVFVTLWAKRELVAAAKRPDSYVFAILHNCIYSHFRKLADERQFKLKFEQEIENGENPVEALLDEKENRDILENIINQLPSQQRLIYKLAKQEGLSRNEIASQLNISSNTVRNHLSASVEYLRTYLKKMFYP
jgi:RNA polymerase sigma-70 factor (ECF subfamily)